MVSWVQEGSGKCHRQHVLVPGLLSQSLRTTKDLSSGLPSPSAAAASAVEAAAAAAASIADSSSSRSRTYSSDVLFEQARPAIGKGLALPPPLLLESLKSLGRGTGPAPPSPSHRPDPPQAPKSPSFPAYHDQATQASPSSDSMSDAAASGDQGLMAVVPPAQDKAGTGNEGSGHSSSGVEPNFISFVTLLRCLGELRQELNLPSCHFSMCQGFSPLRIAITCAATAGLRGVPAPVLGPEASKTSCK
eukprot:scaffold62874_cov17-Tisochrysis_lutea.AAC.1